MWCVYRLNGARLRQVYESKLEAEDLARGGGRGPDNSSQGRGGVSGIFGVTVEGVAISGPLETAGEIRAAMEHDWRSADIGGKKAGYNPVTVRRHDNSFTHSTKSEGVILEISEVGGCMTVTYVSFS